jgi:hypothetical protein
VGFNYWSKGSGKKRSNNSIGSRVLYSGEIQNSKDIPYLKGVNINKYKISKPHNYLKNNYKDFLDKNIDTFRFSANFLEKSPKVIYRQTSNRIIAAIDYDKYYNDKTIHIIVHKSEAFKNKIKLKYLLAILNSSLFYFIYKDVSQEKAGRTFAQVKTTYIKKLPIKIANNNLQKYFVFIVVLTIFAKENNLETEAKTFETVIDGMVFELYFPDHMKERKIDILQFVEKDIEEVMQGKEFEKYSNNQKERVITELSKLWSDPDSEIVKRMNSFAEKSPEILKPILDG